MAEEDEAGNFQRGFFLCMDIGSASFLFIHSGIQVLLGTFHVLSSLLGAEDTMVNRTEAAHIFRGLMFGGETTISKGLITGECVKNKLQKCF